MSQRHSAVHRVIEYYSLNYLSSFEMTPLSRACVSTNYTVRHYYRKALEKLV